MTNKAPSIRLTLIGLNLILFFANCVKEFTYAPPDTSRDKLVVSGLFTNQNERQIVRLSLANDYEYQKFRNVRYATVTIKDDLGNAWEMDKFEYFSDVVDQYYYYLDSMPGVPGHAYSLDIVLETGEHYTTEPQVMPEPILFDSVRVKGEVIQRVQANGQIVNERVAGLYANGKAPQQPKDQYGRFDITSVYIFEESRPLDPFDIQNQCFVRSDFNGQNIALIDFDKRTPLAPYEVKIGQKTIDGTFRIKTCFNATLLTISKQAYEFWEQTAQLIAPTGTILDPPPGITKGNVWLDGDPTKPAIGFFEVASVDVRRKFLGNGQLGYDFFASTDFCSDGDTRSVCRDCRKLGDYASYAKPWYWQ